MKARGAVSPAAEYLAENVHRAAALVFACGVKTSQNGSTTDQATALGNVLPALWSFMLAAWLRGLGTSWTTTALDDKRSTSSSASGRLGHHRSHDPGRVHGRK